MIAVHGLRGTLEWLGLIRYESVARVVYQSEATGVYRE